MTDGHYMERLAAKDIPSSGSITVDQLDTFMQTVTDMKIPQAARTSMSGGNSNMHESDEQRNQKKSFGYED
jgi:hypothetical protein